jgi:hypothetical protein
LRQAREEDIEARHRRQVESRSEAQRRTQTARMAAIHALRVRTVRQLSQARKRAAAVAGPGGSAATLQRGAGTLRSHDIIDRYADYSSEGG